MHKIFVKIIINIFLFVNNNNYDCFKFILILLTQLSLIFKIKENKS